MQLHQQLDSALRLAVPNAEALLDLHAGRMSPSTWHSVLCPTCCATCQSDLAWNLESNGAILQACHAKCVVHRCWGDTTATRQTSGLCETDVAAGECSNAASNVSRVAHHAAESFSERMLILQNPSILQDVASMVVYLHCQSIHLIHLPLVSWGHIRGVNRQWLKINIH